MGITRGVLIEVWSVGHRSRAFSRRSIADAAGHRGWHLPKPNPLPRHGFLCKPTRAPHLVAGSRKIKHKKRKLKKEIRPKVNSRRHRLVFGPAVVGPIVLFFLVSVVRLCGHRRPPPRGTARNAERCRLLDAAGRV